MADVAAPWDREAATFDLQPDHGLGDVDVRQAWRTLLEEHLPRPPARIADLGCGTGSLAVLLAEDGHAVSGADISRQMVVQASAKASATGVSIDLVLGDVVRPPFRPATFDAVLCRHVLWALDDIDAALRSWAGLTRRGGALLLVEGQWSTGGGLPADEIIGALDRLGRHGAVARSLADERRWGRALDDDRYIVVSA